MSEKKYCRLRHEATKAEVQLAEDFMNGEHIIRHFYATDESGLFHEINRQPCKYEPSFNYLWQDTINAYKFKGWEVLE